MIKKTSCVITELNILYGTKYYITWSSYIGIFKEIESLKHSKEKDKRIFKKNTLRITLVLLLILLRTLLDFNLPVCKEIRSKLEAACVSIVWLQIEWVELFQPILILRILQSHSSVSPICSLMSKRCFSLLHFINT